MLFLIALIFFLIVYGFTLLAAIVVVYHFNRFGIRGEYPGKFFIGALFIFSLLLATVMLTMLGQIQKMHTFPANLPFDKIPVDKIVKFDFRKILPPPIFNQK